MLLRTRIPAFRTSPLVVEEANQTGRRTIYLLRLCGLFGVKADIIADVKLRVLFVRMHMRPSA